MSAFFISKPLLQREWGPAGICHRRPIIHDSNLAWPSVPPSMRLIHRRMWDEYCADPVHARPPDCILVSSCQRQDQDETPRRWKRKRLTKRQTTPSPCALAEGSASFALEEVKAPPHPQRRPPPSRPPTTAVGPIKVFGGPGWGDAARSSKLLSNVVRFFSFSPTTFL